MSTTPPVPSASCRRLDGVQLLVTQAPWPFAIAHAEAIAAHWERRKAENPAFFNGRVFVLRSIERYGDGLRATLSLEQFADFLYWRDHAADDDPTLDGFGSALVRSGEGHILLGHNAAGTLNAGSLYLPGGFLDARDVGPDGSIDLQASVARELAEETGVNADTLERVPGTIVSRFGRTCAFAIDYRSPLSSAVLREAMLDGLRRSAEQELSDIVIVRELADLDRLPILDHARFLLRHVLAGAI